MNKLKVFLNTHNFKLIEQNSSLSFGDAFEVFADNNMCIRINRVRSVLSIDVCKVEEHDNWFDLALLKALVV